jgi:hypothetical protein
MNWLKALGIVCIVWGLLMLVFSSMAFGDIGVSFGTQAIFAFMLGIGFLLSGRQIKIA